LTWPFCLILTVALPSAASRASGALPRVSAVGGVFGVVFGVMVRAEGGIGGIRGSALGSGAGWVAAHASAGVLPLNPWWGRSWLQYRSNWSTSDCSAAIVLAGGLALSHFCSL
jgi:hypothetical protein